MSEPVPEELHATLDEIRSQLTSLAERVAAMEKLVAAAGNETAPAARAGTAAAPAPPALPETAALAKDAGITEEEVLAISAALAAWLGVHAHIRQIRLIRTGAWAQQGRVTIQASHTLNY